MCVASGDAVSRRHDRARPVVTTRETIMRRMTLLGSVALVVTSACGTSPANEGVIKRFPIADLDGVIETSGVVLDQGTSADGNGALRILAESPKTIRLYEIDAPHVSGSRLIYRARLRSQDLNGAAYLEMWCRFGEQGEFFSRALHAPISGTTEWVSQETPFFLSAGQVPDHVRLNVVVAGSGTVWVDDVALAEGPG